MPESTDNDGGPALDVEALFASLQDGIRREELVAQQRPNGAILAETMRNFIDITYSTFETNRVEQETNAGDYPGQHYDWLAAPGSTAETERALAINRIGFPTQYREHGDPLTRHAHPLLDPVQWAIDHMTRNMYAAIDQLASTGTLIESGDHMRGPVTLARAALEAAANAQFMADTTITGDERLRRILNFQLIELKEESNEKRSTLDLTQIDEERQIEDILRTAVTVGLSPVRYKASSFHAPQIPKAGSHRSESAQQIIQAVLEEDLGITMWRSLSAIAHGRHTATMLDGMYSLPHTIKPERRTKNAAWHTIPALIAFARAAKEVGAYLGWNVSLIAEAAEPTAEIWGVGGGLADDAIRSSLGFDN